MTITNGYTTLADVKSLLRITNVDAADDAVIERLVESASRVFDGESERRFYTTAADETRVFQAESSGLCYIDDCISVTSLKTDDDGSRAYATTWAATDYDTMPYNAALRGAPFMWIETTPNGAHSFPSFARGVQLVGKFGYATAAPMDVKQAVEDIVTGAYKRRFGENVTGVSEVTAAGVVITPRDIPDSAWKVIMRYRKLV